MSLENLRVEEYHLENGPTLEKLLEEILYNRLETKLILEKRETHPDGIENPEEKMS